MMQSQVDRPNTKRFTLDEANAMLPLVKSIAEDILSVYRTVTSRQADLRRLLRQSNRTAGSMYADEIAESRIDLQIEYDRIWQYREELESLGVLLRQPQEGLIEFPTLIDQCEAFYSWKPGEPTVTHWRYADDPWSHRRDIVFSDRNPGDANSR
ncbi:MAG: hypothetical protein KatS3mg111_3560 [Pirellulaceae bacterium]|nr:MAG: hypothetical protein KatS3mg111_3560 [Pirellulaceae bacterium]